jgi:regulator of cell morphogenesis and NO signaling
MTQDKTLQAQALIEQIQSRYHDAHRQALPPLLAMAQAVEAGGGLDGITADFQALADTLELHMFKEEMRLFPMMEQGGNTLIEQLIDDLHAEHAEHDDMLHGLQGRLDAVGTTQAAHPAFVALRQAFHDLRNELREHIQAEDEVLFRRP